MVYVVVTGTENMGGGYFEVFTSWQRGRMAAWPCGRKYIFALLRSWQRVSMAAEAENILI